MIVFIQGRILQKTMKAVFILTASGVGYEVFVPLLFLENCKSDETVELYTHLHIRENEMDLYGFETLEQRQFFRQLLTIKGIGPKMGLEIISQPTDILNQAFLYQDPAILSSIKGIGKKTAERLLLELKNIYQPFDMRHNGQQKEYSVHQEAVDALMQLGYEKHRIYRLFADLPSDVQDTEKIIRWFLSNCEVKARR